jgi:hypothetical protein
MLALLMEAALRSLLLGLAVWLGLRIFRVRSPHLQMTAWIVVLAASLAMPVLMRGLTVTVPAGAPPLVKIERLPPERVSDALTSPSSPYLQPDMPAFPPPAAETGEAPRSRLVPPAGIDWRSAAGWSSLATGLYLLVAGVTLFRLLLGLVLTWRLRQTSQPVREQWTAGTDVRISDVVSMPVTFGATILVPSDFTAWSAIKRQAALSHERSHMSRGDFYVLLAAGLNRCLFWFSPLSWWLVTALTELAEILSDAAAIAAVGDRASYAEILLDVARGAGRPPAALAMARPHTVRLRIERILAATGLPASIGWRRRASFATALLPVVAICAVTIAPGGSSSRAIAQGAPAATGGDPQGLDRYVGFYRADPSVYPALVLTITREGGHFFEQQTGRARLEIVPQNDHEFFYGINDSRITFLQDAQRRTTGLVLHEIDRDVSATRTDEAEARRASDLYERRFADQARPRRAVTIDPVLFDRYVGYYALSPRLVFRITRDGDRFFIQQPRQVKVELFAESETDYFETIAPAQITFTIDGQGHVTGLVLHQNGRDMLAKRVDEAQAQQADAAVDEQTTRLADRSRPRTAIAVDPQSQNPYVGFYEIVEPRFIVAITRTGAQLFAQQTGRRRLPIFPDRDGEYFYKADAAQITFVTDSQGRVSGLVLHQGAQDLRAARVGDVPAADQPPVAVDPATFDDVVGWYESPFPLNVLTVTREGDRLFVQETGLAKTELIPRSAVGYTAAGGGPDVVFERADQGQASALILYDEAKWGAWRATRIEAARARQVEEVAARRLADAPERFKNQMPAPGTEAALRHHIEAFARGAPDYGQMTASRAETIRSNQTSYLLNSFTALGSVESTIFKGVGPGGFDIYTVKFAHGAAQIRLSLTDDGKLQGLNFRPDGDGSPGAVVACSEEDKLKPSLGAVPIQMTLVNRSGSDIRVSILNFSGKRMPFTTLLDEGSIVFPNFAVLPLVVTDLSERCLQIIVPGASTQRIAIMSAVPDGPSRGAASPRVTPTPGGEAALRQLIDGIRRGEPDYARMSVQAANAMHQQLRLHREIWARMGVVQVISFVGVGSAGEDIYEVRCENGSAEVHIDLLKDGRIGSMALGPE